jgi:hypothetical protein
LLNSWKISRKGDAIAQKIAGGFFLIGERQFRCLPTTGISSLMKYEDMTRAEHPAIQIYTAILNDAAPHLKQI